MALVNEPGLATAAAPALLERDDALGSLAALLADVAQSLRGRVVFVAGEAGAGKTALLRTFCESAPRETDVHWATCDALATPRPLGRLLDVAKELGGFIF
jgi:predicted ATPase